ncbi:MAG: hypothetical protein ABIL05_03075 [candidate division WOR-3 bacterium]
MKRIILLFNFVNSLLLGDVLLEQVLRADGFMGTATSEIRSKTLVHGDRLRVDTRIKICGLTSGKIEQKQVTIIQLDKEKVLNLDPKTKTYRETDFSELREKAGHLKSRIQPRSSPAIEIIKKDETKRMVGHNCKHIIVKMKTRISDPETGEPIKGVLKNDMWISDLFKEAEVLVNFNKRFADATGIPALQQDMMREFGIDTYEYAQFEETIRAIKGFPIYTLVSIESEELNQEGRGYVFFSAVNEIKKISPVQTGAGEFEIPKGYKKIEDNGKIY